MPRLLIINRSQAPYYKALYSALGRSLHDVGWEALLITLDKHWDGFKGHRFQRDLVIPRDIEVMEIQAKRVAKIGDLPTSEMSNAFHEFQPDVVLVHETALFNLGAVLSAWRKRIPLLVSTEIGVSNLHKGCFPWHVKLARKWIRPVVSGVVAHSPAAVESDLGVEEDRVAKAYHAYDAGNIIPRDTSGMRDEIQLVFLGQVIPRKGLDLWLQVMASAQEEGISVFLNVIGRGEDEWFENEVDRYGLKDSVCCHGFLEGEAIAQVMRSSEVFVLPSRFDTYGAVTQEAACYGLALVVSKNAGSHELVESGENGYVIDPEDISTGVDALRALQDQKHRATLMRAARATGVEYGAGKSAERIASLIKKIYS